MAIQSIAPVARIIVGVIIIILAIYGYRFYMDAGKLETSGTSSLSRPELTDSLEEMPVVSAPEKQSESKSRETVETEHPGQPEFHVLRVEKDGSVVIAGSAFASSLVEIILDGKTIASATASDNGDFAIVLDESLSPGAHELYIRSTSREGVSILSEQAGVVNIPEQGNNEVIAMIARPGEASTVTQIPEIVTERETGEKTQSQAAGMSQADPEIDSNEEIKQPAIRQVLLGSVEMENEQLFVAGTGESGHNVNLYIDNGFIGQTMINSQNMFLLEKRLKLEPGNHTVRVDMLEKESAEVIARAEMPFVHDVSSDVEQSSQQVIAGVRDSGSIPAEDSIGEVSPEGSIDENSPEGFIHADSSVVVRKGDSLWRLSRRILGHGIRYITIYNANRSQIKNPDLIFPGQIFRIPDIKEERAKDHQTEQKM